VPHRLASSLAPISPAVPVWDAAAVVGTVGAPRYRFATCERACVRACERASERECGRDRADAAKGATAALSTATTLRMMRASAIAWHAPITGHAAGQAPAITPLVRAPAMGSR
jgi:hypothetical protein